MTDPVPAGAPPTPAPVAFKDIAGSVYAPVIGSQLDQERSRKSSIEGRAITIVSTSGALLAIFAGFLTVLKGTSHDVPAQLLVPLGFAYALFAVVAACGILASARGNTQEAYGEFHTHLLRVWLPDWASPNTADAVKVIADQQLTVLGNMRGDNLAKWRLMVAGVSAQILAVAIFAAALGHALFR
jgi:hypothetical protein